MKSATQKLVQEFCRTLNFGDGDVNEDTLQDLAQEVRTLALREAVEAIEQHSQRNS